MTAVELKYIQTMVPNRHLVGLIAEYYANDNPLRRLHDLVGYVEQNHADITKHPPYDRDQFRKFQWRLQNRRDVAVFFSILYCGVFNKELPMKTIIVPKRKVITGTCRCSRTVYLKRQDSSPIYCTYCAYNGGRDRDPYSEIGQDTPITHTITVPRATRAFRLVSYYHQKELLDSARQIYEWLK